MHRSRNFGGRIVAGALAIAVGTGSPAWGAIEEIRVSARKRDENLQDVPISVEAFTIEEIERLNINSLDDITNRSSSLILDQGFSPQDTRIVIRGLAPIQGRQNAAVLQDGIDITSQAITTNGGSLLINPRLFDIERVEVVKGPQNALYGRSAFAGAINYITRKPSEDLRITAGTDVGNNGQLEFRGGLSGPILGNTLLGGLNVATWEHDGFYSNPITGSEIGGQSGDAVAGTLVWNATDRLSFTARGEYTEDEFEPTPYFGLLPVQQIPIPPQAVGTVVSSTLTSIGGIQGSLPDRGTRLGPDAIAGGVVAPTISENPRTGEDYPGTDREITRFTLTADWKTDVVDILYLGHFANQESLQNLDGQRQGSITGQGLSYGAELLFFEDTDLQSHELRFQSTGQGPLSWTFGALYWEQEQDFRDGSFNCIANEAFVPFPPPGFLAPPDVCGPAIASVDAGIDGANRFPDTWGRDTEHWSAYFLFEYEFLEDFAVTVEGRYTDEDLSVTGPNRTNAGSRIIDPRGIFGPPTLGPQDGTFTGTDTDSFFTPKVTLQWTPTDDSLYYFSYAQGRKPSGIAALNGGAGSFNPDDQRFEQEKVNVYELGGKTTWLDNRLTLNGALFFQDYTDKQTNTQVPVGDLLTTRPVNASSAEVWGLELDVTWLPTDNLTLTASYTFLDTEYKDFRILNGGAGPIAQAGNCVVRDIFDDQGNLLDTTCQLDYSGNQLEYAPEHSFVGSATYRRTLVGATDWFVEGELIYQDERFQDNANTVLFDAYDLWNFRAGISNETWDVLAYVDNAFEDETIKTGFRSIWTGGFGFAPNPFTVVLPSTQVAILPPLRQVGVRVNYRFGGEGR